MVRTPSAPAFFAAALMAAGIVAGQTAEDSQSAVRSARSAFNRALERHDSAAIGRLLAPMYHVVTGRSDQLDGGIEEERRWAGRFRGDRTLTYTRVSKDVSVNEAWGMAHENGDWSGRFTSSRLPVRVSGVYAAKWQRAENGQWLLLAEIFTTLKCEGPESGCIKPAPIFQ